MVSVLTKLANEGWHNVILSNHVPELPAIVDGVGLGAFVDNVISSANAGYEKPHPAIFDLARKLFGDPKEVWMVGDNPQDDVEGARTVGIPAILVQRPDRPSTPGALSLLEAERSFVEDRIERQNSSPTWVSTPIDTVRLHGILDTGRLHDTIDTGRLQEVGKNA